MPTSRKTMTEPCVSVVVPCHNYGEYLSEAVCSVVAQSYRDWELIIVDDGSEDDTSQIVKGLIDEFAHLRISLIQQPNRGVSHARNTAIAAAQGRYILPLDADDVLADTMLERTVELLEADPAVAIAYTDMFVFGDQVPTYVRQFPDYDFDLLRQQQILFYCSLFRRHVWEATGGFSTDLVAYEDWDFWLSCGERGFQARRIPEPLFGVRHKPSGLHTEGFRRDQKLRALITLRHPDLFNKVTRTWAEAIVEGDDGTDERIPDEILSRAQAVGWLCQAFMAMDHEVIQLRREVHQAHDDERPTSRPPWLTAFLLAGRRRRTAEQVG